MRLAKTYDDRMQYLLQEKTVADRAASCQRANLTWDDVAGLHTAKQLVRHSPAVVTPSDILFQLQECIVWPSLYPEYHSSSGSGPSRSVLLYGPPGTGKTRLAQVVGKDSTERQIYK